MALFIRADQVLDCGGGVFRIEFPETSLTDEQRKVLRELFPNLSDRAYTLLDQEAMVRSLLDPEEAEAHMNRGDRSPDPQPVRKLPKMGKPTPVAKSIGKHGLVQGPMVDDDDDQDAYVPPL
jgi:hypothetical protein